MCKILVDADGCPVVSVIESLAKKHGVEVLLICDYNHDIKSDYATVIQVCQGENRADIEIFQRCKRGDIVVTQDFGLAALVLSKGCYCLHHNGREYTDYNIDKLLFYRAMNSKRRRNSGHVKCQKKHKKGRNFARVFDAILYKAEKAEQMALSL